MSNEDNKYVAVHDANVGEFAVSGMIVLLGVCLDNASEEDVNTLLSLARRYHQEKTEEEKFKTLVEFGGMVDKCCKAQLEKYGEEVQ